MEPARSAAKPKELGPGWWIIQCAGLAVTLALMGVLAFALMMLTRILVEGTTEPDAHLPTFVVWLILCVVLVVGPMMRATWCQLADERVHVDPAGNELRIDRWSPPPERERFVERVAADERARERRHPIEAERAPVRHEPSADELRAAASRRREVGPGISTSVRAGRWSGPLHRLEVAAYVCLVGWLPTLIVSAVTVEVLPDGVAREWMLLPLLLLPVGWLLLEAHHALRHRWLRTSESRSDLALFQGASALVTAFVLGLVAFTGLVMREDHLGVALTGFPLAVLFGWLGSREMRHVIHRGSDGGGDQTLPTDLSWID